MPGFFFKPSDTVTLNSLKAIDSTITRIQQDVITLESAIATAPLLRNPLYLPPENGGDNTNVAHDKKVKSETAELTKSLDTIKTMSGSLVQHYVRLGLSSDDSRRSIKQRTAVATSKAKNQEIAAANRVAAREAKLALWRIEAEDD
jgi:hypothetical protein